MGGRAGKYAFGEPDVLNNKGTAIWTRPPRHLREGILYIHFTSKRTRNVSKSRQNLSTVIHYLHALWPLLVAVFYIRDSIRSSCSTPVYFLMIFCFYILSLSPNPTRQSNPRPTHARRYGSYIPTSEKSTNSEVVTITNSFGLTRWAFTGLVGPLSPTSLTRSLRFLTRFLIGYPR